MFANFSFWEILLILVAVLLLFGAKRIPEIAGSFGKGIREFKKSLTDVDRAISEPEPTEQPRIDRPREADRATVAKSEETKETEPKRLLG